MNADDDTTVGFRSLQSAGRVRTCADTADELSMIETVASRSTRKALSRTRDGTAIPLLRGSRANRQISGEWWKN
jgi:hypothetical protein